MTIHYEKLLPDVVQILLNNDVEEESFNRNRAIYAIQQAYREFVRDTNVVRTIVPVPTQANVSEYSLFKHDDQVIGKIYSVALETSEDNWTTLKRSKPCGCGSCSGSYSYDDGFLTVCPAPTCNGLHMELCVSLFPQSDACDMDERVYERYRDYIAAGAASKLLPATVSRRFEEDFTIGKDLAAAAAASQWSKRPARNKGAAWRRR